MLVCWYVCAYDLLHYAVSLVDLAGVFEYMDVLIPVDFGRSRVTVAVQTDKTGEREGNKITFVRFSFQQHVLSLKYLHEQARVCDRLCVCVCLSNRVRSPTCSDPHYQSTSSRSRCTLHLTIEVSRPRNPPALPVRQMEPDVGK